MLDDICITRGLYRNGFERLPCQESSGIRCFTTGTSAKPSSSASPSFVVERTLASANAGAQHSSGSCKAVFAVRKRRQHLSLARSTATSSPPFFTRLAPWRLLRSVSAEVSTRVSSITARPERPLPSTTTSDKEASTLFLAKIPSKGPGMASLSPSSCPLPLKTPGLGI